MAPLPVVVRLKDQRHPGHGRRSGIIAGVSSDRTKKPMIAGCQQNDANKPQYILCLAQKRSHESVSEASGQAMVLSRP